MSTSKRTNRFRRHRSLDLRAVKQIKKTDLQIINEDSSSNCKWTEQYIYETRRNLEQLSDELEKISGPDFRKFLMSRLDPYIIDFRMDSSRPLVCDKCNDIVLMSNCTTCDSCHSFYCNKRCTDFICNNSCKFCKDVRNICSICLQRSISCQICKCIICRDCLHTHIKQFKTCKCHNNDNDNINVKIVCRHHKSRSKALKCNHCKKRK